MGAGMNTSFESNRVNVNAINKPTFIVFTGPALSGKTTAAQFMVSYMHSKGIVAYRDSFEAPMKCYLGMLFSQKVSTLPADEVMPWMNKTPRDFMLREQQHMRFTYGPAILGELLNARSVKWKTKPEYIIVDDGTSINDVRALGSYVLVRIARMFVDRVYPFTIPDPKYVVSNKGTELDLHNTIVNLTRKITGETK